MREEEGRTRRRKGRASDERKGDIRARDSIHVVLRLLPESGRASPSLKSNLGEGGVEYEAKLELLATYAREAASEGAMEGEESRVGGGGAARVGGGGVRASGGGEVEEGSGE